MSALLGILLLAVSVLLFTLSAFLLIQVLASWSARVSLPKPRGDRPHPRVAILMPAHNEEAGIATGVRPALAELGPDDRLIVIADNCSDATAAIARELGAEVLERSDTSRRGKGYALDFGLRHLASDPPEVLVVVDADCVLAPGSLGELAERCADTGRPQQALDLMVQPEGVTALKARVSEFAWRVKNQVRPLGSRRLGLPCQLMGTGMAFPWGCLDKVSLATSSIVEDMKLGVELALQGTPVQFCPDARVTSEFPSGDEDAGAQRQRWEHGHLGIITEAVPSMLLEGLRRGDRSILGLTLDLAVPPLAFFVLGQGAWLLLMLVFAALGGASGPLALGLLSLACVAGALTGAWYRWARDLITASELVRLPAYALLKIPMYVAFWTRRQTAWVRARRD